MDLTNLRCVRSQKRADLRMSVHFITFLRMRVCAYGKMDYTSYGNSKLLLVYNSCNSYKEIRSLLVSLKKLEKKTIISFRLWRIVLSVTHCAFRQQLLFVTKDSDRGYSVSVYTYITIFDCYLETSYVVFLT
jgi:hypothetical protein